MYLCHTSCDLLNVGTLEAYLTTVGDWMRQNPYDVVTILMGNYDYVAPGNFTAPFANAGLTDLIYTPSKIPMALDDWPTLSHMILTGKRLVVFMDYQANQTAIPWLMDEFSQMWETPFSPTNRNFPCTVQRPPGLSGQDAEHRLYLANHNLNLQLQFASVDILIPNIALIDQTNAVAGFGSLGRMAENCTRKFLALLCSIADINVETDSSQGKWNRPPNFLLVDYYNYAKPNSSVFEVAAEMNHVTYNGHCCGTTSAAAGRLLGSDTGIMAMLALGLYMFSALV